MANQKKTYYLPPTWDIPPGGPLSLGSVLSSVKRPLPPLAIGSVASTSTSPTPSTADASAQAHIYYSTKRNFSYSTSASYSGSAELSVSFLSSVLGVAPTASTNLQRDNTLTLSFSRLDTQEWFPSTEELQTLIQQLSVSQYLHSLRKWVPKQVFVVTGVKVAYGARAETKKGHEVESSLEVSIDPGLAGGTPGVVTIGPKVGHGTKKGTEVGWETGTDGEDDPGLLFAYKVQRVKVKQAGNEDKPTVTSHSEYTSGALHGADSLVAEEQEPFHIDPVVAEDASETGVFVEADDGSGGLWFVPPSQ